MANFYKVISVYLIKEVMLNTTILHLSLTFFPSRGKKEPKDVSLIAKVIQGGEMRWS